MAEPQILEFIVLVFKPDAVAADPSSPPAAFKSEFLSSLPTIGGDSIAGLYLGRAVEHPQRWVMAMRWASAAAHDAFLASPAAATALGTLFPLLDSFAATSSFEVVGGDATAVLEAPCTEIYTAYGTQNNFLDARMRPFAAVIDDAKFPGYHASVYGQFEQKPEDGHDYAPGTAVRFILGWDSKAAHLAQRGEGKSEFAAVERVCGRTSTILTRTA